MASAASAAPLSPTPARPSRRCPSRPHPPPAAQLRTLTGSHSTPATNRRNAALCQAAASHSEGIAASAITQPGAGSALSATQVVQSFFDAFNRRDMDALLALYAEDCTHHDLAYSEPAVGIEATKRFVEEFTGGLPADVQFVVEDITSGDATSVGVIWHMEIGGVDLPLGKGVSFYKVNEQGRIYYVRECPEHFAKIAFAAPSLLSMAAPLIRSVGSLVGSPPPTTSSFSSVAAPASQPAWRAPTPPASSFSASYPASASAELPLPDISGAWTKDMKRSDLSTYDRALEMMGIRGIQKTTARLIDGVELSLTERDFTMRFLTIVPYFNVTEVYRFGEETEMSRRDLRDGWQRGAATILPDGTLQLVVELGPRDGWKLTDVFERRGADELLIHSTVEAEGKVETVTMIYTRGHS
mmetsp:Transcript_3058/g.7623  ORF Transcript_3058/g.7623 Transcript_3058/m.7623 type:complete len:413 (+) Transcript_3058:219-1457(+)